MLRIAYSFYDLEVDLALLLRRVQDMGKESDDAKRNVQGDTVVDPFLLAG